MKLSDIPAGAIKSATPVPYPPEQQAILDLVLKKWEDAIRPKMERAQQLQHGSYEWRMAADELREYIDRAALEYGYELARLPNPGYLLTINPSAGIDYSGLLKFTPLTA